MIVRASANMLGAGHALRYPRHSRARTKFLLCALAVWCVVYFVGPGTAWDIGFASPVRRCLRQDAYQFRRFGQVSCSAAPVVASAPLGNYAQSWSFGQIVGDIAAVVTLPFRIMSFKRITHEVFDDMRKRRGFAVGGAATQFMDTLPAWGKSHAIGRTSTEAFKDAVNTTLTLVIDSIMAEKPYDFAPYHKAIRGPDVDHYTWGNDFFRPMVKYRSSRVEGLANVASIRDLLAAGDNVVLLANHQTEADPQVLSILLELVGHGDLAEQMIFVAGHKVQTDRLAVPFSMGRNLLTIFSKRYLGEFSEAEQEQKAARNRLTVAEMQRLIKEGGNIFWVAPSGGRDHPTPDREHFHIQPDKFDEQSVNLFFLLGQKASKSSTGSNPSTHFFPLAMWTHRFVPPPAKSKKKVGEVRSAQRAAVGIEFGTEIDLVATGGRKGLCEAAEAAVRSSYDHLDSLLKWRSR